MKFPADYPIFVLRGLRVPTPERAVKMLERRIAWLVRKLEERPGALVDSRSGFYVSELAATAAAIEALKEASLSDKPLQKISTPLV